MRKGTGDQYSRGDWLGPCVLYYQGQCSSLKSGGGGDQYSQVPFIYVLDVYVRGGPSDCLGILCNFAHLLHLCINDL